jgi:hypothetical protein
LKYSSAGGLEKFLHFVHLDLDSIVGQDVAVLTARFVDLLQESNKKTSNSREIKHHEENNETMIKNQKD